MARPHPFQSKRLHYHAIEDYDVFLHSIQSDARAYANSSASLHVPESMAATKRWKKHLLDECMLGVIICLAPSPGSSSTPPIGVISLEASPLHVVHHRNSMISVDIVAAHQGKGYGSEAIRWALKWGFQTAGLHRIGIGAFGFNEGAVRLYARLGFKEEGRRRECLWYEGEWWDEVEFGMLEGEWREMVKGE
ncbi:GNAT family acetyltransferase [Mytilinidion resinicola]|uniref:GNAT family acetyltransferase n=1 Tax=Mytilinidion resinicola TaxID=574789 RepID=A0A6A6YQX9_9PEZI|nr:GNAT family acetyltransferase [Mytilinidion resinicola]KAF2810919.1 GNAT family acetyltransferase [Mytilinidion resinicola]